MISKGWQQLYEKSKLKQTVLSNLQATEIFFAVAMTTLALR